jgi:hypothetical protein
MAKNNHDIALPQNDSMFVAVGGWWLSRSDEFSKPGDIRSIRGIITEESLKIHHRPGARLDRG